MSLARYIAAVLLAPVVSVLTMSTLPAAPAADGLLTIRDCNYGDVYQFSSAGCTASLQNNGDKPLVLSIIAVQSGNTVEPDKLTLAPHAHADVVTHVRTDNVAGEITWSFRIEGEGKDPHFLRAHGFIMSVLDEAHPKIEFGPIDPAKTSVTKSVAFLSSVDHGVRIKKILSSPEFLHTKIGDDSKALISEIDATAPWGPFDETVKVAVDTPLQREVWVEVNGKVEGDIGPKENPFWLGDVPWQAKRTLTVPLTDREGRDFKIGSVTSKEFKATYDSTNCDPAQAGCRILLIHVADSQPAGFFKNELDVALPDRNKHLTLTLWGVFGEKPRPGETPAPMRMTKVQIPDPNAKPDGDAPPMKVQPDPPGTGPLLKWVIAHQDSVRGYQVFRGDSPDGAFELMNAEIIPTLENGSGSVAYRWRDTKAVQGQTYWYYIAVLYKSGDRRALSGPQKTVAK
jgi:hypothetical protein